MTSSASADLQRARATLFLMAEVINLANQHMRREGPHAFEVLMVAELCRLNVQPAERAAELAHAVVTLARAYATDGTTH